MTGNPQEWQPKPPKKTTTWRTCPKCGSRVTKLFNLTTGLYTCQMCRHEYLSPQAANMKEQS